MDNSNMNQQPMQPMQPPMGAPMQQPMQPPMGAPMQQPMQPMYQQAPAQPRADQSKLFAILAYIPLLFLVGMFVTPECRNPFVKNHVNNGIIVTILSAAAGLFRWIFGLIAISLGEIFLAILMTVALTIMVIGMVDAATGKYHYLPIIGNKLVIIK